MNDQNPFENQLRSWIPRPPSARLKRRVFSAIADSNETVQSDFVGGWRWLAPVLGCLLVMASIFNSKEGGMSDLEAQSTNNLLAVWTNSRGSAAYIMAGFHSKQNAVGMDTLEWTKAQGLSSSVGSFPAFNTNHLVR